MDFGPAGLPNRTSPTRSVAAEFPRPISTVRNERLKWATRRANHPTGKPPDGQTARRANRHHE
jgi:hypothetical protein